jgi:hypothetical protein
MDKEKHKRKVRYLLRKFKRQRAEKEDSIATQDEEIETQDNQDNQENLWWWWWWLKLLLMYTQNEKEKKQIR